MVNVPSAPEFPARIPSPPDHRFATICSGRDDRAEKIETPPLKLNPGLSGPRSEFPNFHIRVGLSRRFCELAVFDARLYIGVRRVDEPGQFCGVCGCSRSQLHMAHELADALQQVSRIRQRCTVKEPYVYVRSEYIDVAEGRVSQTCNRTAVMQKLPDFVPAFSHYLKPPMRDGSQFTCMLFHPRIDGGITLDSSVESQQFRSHCRFTFYSRESVLTFDNCRHGRRYCNLRM